MTPERDGGIRFDIERKRSTRVRGQRAYRFEKKSVRLSEVKDILSSTAIAQVNDFREWLDGDDSESAADIAKRMRENLAAMEKKYRATTWQEDKEQGTISLDGGVDFNALIEGLAVAPDAKAREKVADQWVLERGKETGLEHLVFLDKEGFPLAVAKGEKGNIGFPAHFSRMGREGLVAYATHNHPSGVAFSAGDMNVVLTFTGTRIVAMGHTGTRYEAEQGPLAVQLPAFFLDPKATALRRAHTRIDRSLYAMMQGELNGAQVRGEDTRDLVTLFNKSHAAVISVVFERLGILTLRGDAERQAQEYANGRKDLDTLVRTLVDAGVLEELGAAGHDVAALRDRLGSARASRDDAPDAGNRGGDRPAQQPPRGGDGGGRLPLDVWLDSPIGETKFRGRAEPSPLRDRRRQVADITLPNGKTVTIELSEDFPASGDPHYSAQVIFGSFRNWREVFAGREAEMKLLRDAFGASDVIPVDRPPRKRASKKESMTDAEKARLDAIKRKFSSKLRDQLNSGLDPELVQLAIEAAQIYIKAGARKFRDFLLDMAEDFGVDPKALGRYARIAYNDVRDELEAAGQDVADMDSSSAVLAALKEIADVPGAGSNLEPNSGDAAPSDGVGQADVSAPGGRSGSRSGGRGGSSGGRGGQRGRRGGVPDGDASRVGGRGDQGVPGEARPNGQSPDDRDGAGGRGDRERGLPPDRGSDQDLAKHARDEAPVSDRVERQRAADKKPIRFGDEQNIRDTLPLLLPEQQDDVLKVEQRFAKPDGHGILLTNGTGTGKTYSGAGVIKRFVRQGKDNVLVVAPSQGILDAWAGALADLGIPSTKLEDTKSAGEGVTLTTYANLGTNTALSERDWDLIVPDEAHYLSMNQEGDPTAALQTMRAITNHPGSLWLRGRMANADKWAIYKKLPDSPAKTAMWAELDAESKAAQAEYAKKPRSKVLFLSATPFAYDKNVDFAEGYLFTYGEDGVTESGSRQSGRNLFMVSNFGYRIRYHKLTKPEAAVDTGVFEREFHEKLKREGMLSGRSLDIAADYDRKFSIAHDKIGAEIDEILDWIGQRAMGGDAVKRRPWEELQKAINRSFNYLKRRQFLEQIKARAAIPDIQKHLALGRKVVVFHDYNVGGGVNPFSNFPDSEATAELYAAFPQIETWDFSSYRTPITTMSEAFGSRAAFYNGRVSKGERAENLKAFNRDGSGVDVLVVQSAAGREGLSAHDVSGNHQRALLNLGMPAQPTTALQQEGRIRRTGSVSDAVFRYYTTGTSWERQAFAGTIAERSGTVENLALGDEARTIRDSFIEAYMEAEVLEPNANEGKGGRERDRAVAKTTPWQRAISHYFARMKNTAKRQNRRGVDFYATPEPVGVKMVEWARVGAYEKVLEPSAGDGAIARYFPGHADRTIVEPSMELRSEAMLRAPGARVHEGTFESLHVVNKYHAIVMNPPYGSGGKTAIEHLAKAAKHLKEGGRIVALIPTGPAADKRFDAWYESDEAKGFHLNGDYKLPAVTFEKAGTAVATRIVIIDRITDPTVAAEITPRRANLTGADSIQKLFDRIENLSGPERSRIVEAADPFEDADAAEQADQDEAPALQLHVSGFDLGETTHAKTGDKLWVATFQARVDRAVYDAAVVEAKKHGGWYSSFRGRGAIPGFQFKSEAGRQRFIEAMNAPVVSKDQRLTHIFYSPLRRALEGAKQVQAPAQDWKAIIGKLDGVKRTEVEWLGVEEWLDAQEGQVSKDALLQFVSANEIVLDEEVYGDVEREIEMPRRGDYINEWRTPEHWEAEWLIDDSGEFDEPDYVISEGEPVYPDDYDDEADNWMDEARAELLEDAQNDWDGEGDEPTADDLDDALVREKAREIAEERFEPWEYTVTLYDREGKWPSYEGYFDNNDSEYFFHDLVQADGGISYSDAVFHARQVWKDAREAAIEAKLEELRASGLNAQGQTRAEWALDNRRGLHTWLARRADIVQTNRAIRETNRERGVDGPARHSRWTESGGSDYREIVLTVPDLHEVGPNDFLSPPERAELTKIEGEIAAIRGTLAAPDAPGAYHELSAEDRVRYDELLDRKSAIVRNRYSQKRPFAQRGHFERENIVVHARVKDRTDADGKRILFVEEVQSDLGSVWRKSTEAPDITARREAARQLHRDLYDERRRLVKEAVTIIADRFNADVDPLWNSGMIEEGLATAIDEVDLAGLPRSSVSAPKLAARDLLRELDGEKFDTLVDVMRRDLAARDEILNLGTERKPDPTLPDMPFKGDAYYTLMVKRLLRLAAERGYDGLSWTPGYMQAERWGKAAQSVVEGVEWYIPDANFAPAPGSRVVDLAMSGGRRLAIDVMADGTISKDAAEEALRGEPLSRLLGPNLAKQIMTEESGAVDGQKITFPGSGYAIAYDGHIKRAVEKLAKKHGGKVSLDQGMPDFAPYTAPAGRKALLSSMTTEEIGEKLRAVGVDTASLFSARNMEEARWALRSRGQNYTDDDARRDIVFGKLDGDVFNKAFGAPPGKPVWRVDITPELREAALRPQSLFQQRRDYARTVQLRASLKEIMPFLRAELDRLDLKRVRLTELREDGAQARFDVNRMGDMTILINAALAGPNRTDYLQSLYHEVIHALRALGLFTPREWATLEQAAARRWVEKYDILSRYGDLLPSEQLEEAIAEAMGDHGTARKAPSNAVIRRAFEKIDRFFRALWNALRGNGFQTPEDVFGRVLSGEIGRRDRGAVPRLMAAEQREAVAELTGRELGDAADIRSLGRAAEQWYRENLVGSTATHRETGMVVQFNNVGARKVGGRKGETLFKLVPAIRQIIEGGRLVETLTDRHARDNVRAIHKIAGRVLLGGQPRDVVVTVREMRDGTFHYDLSRDMSDGARFQRDGRPAMKAGGGMEQGSSPVELNIYPDAAGSNAEAERGGARIGAASRSSPSQDVSTASREGLGYGPTGASSRRASAGTDTIAGLRAGNDVSQPSLLSKYQRPNTMRHVTAQGRAHRATAMGGRLFVPDRRIWEELTAANAGLWDRLRGAGAAAHDLIDKARIKLQDRFLPVLRAQQAVERGIGAVLPEEQNAYLAEETFSGKVGRHLFEIDEDFTKPIIDALAETKGGVTVDDAGLWLYARHAIERNARIAEINEDMPDGGSGMMTEEAVEILDAARASPHRATYERIGRLIDQLRERTLKLREDAGLISNADAALWRSMYRHYVPLKGFAETDHAEAMLDITGLGRRFNTRGPESRRALGRYSTAFNPLQAAITQAQEASIRAEKNRVGQAVYNLAKAHPSKALWEVKKPKTTRYFNKTTGMVETRVEDPMSLIMQPNEMAVKVNGQERRIVFHDERIARSLGTVGADQMGWFISIMSKAARWFSAVNTMLDPEFVIRNAFRDLTAAQINIREFGGEDRNALAKAMIRDWPKAWKAAYRGQLNKADTEWTRWYKEFEESGAKVSFWQLDQPEAGKADLERRIMLAGGGSVLAQASKFVRISTRDNPVLGFIERVNLAVDNAIRLSAYVQARKKGWTKAQAASLSKNLTVNFNRRGEWGATLNALYIFYNAAIQGTQILFRALSSRRMAKYPLMLIALGFLLDQVNAAMSEEDEDGELAYDKIPDFKNQTNLVVMLGPESGNAATIWLPYGYNVFPYLGQQASKVTRGVKDPGEALASLAKAFFTAFSPISGGSFQATITPTMLDPINEMAMNEDWLGRPIRPENAYADYGPNAYKYFAGASLASRVIADAMNRATGGDRAEAGLVDVSPEYIDHAFGFITGGAGRFTGRTIDLMSKLITGQTSEIEANDVPFYRSLQYETSDWLDRDRYYRFRDEVRQAQAAVKVYREEGRAVPSDLARKAALSEKMREIERRLRQTRDARRALDANDTLPASLRNERKERIAAAEAQLFLAFNRRYLAIAGPQSE